MYNYHKKIKKHLKNTQVLKRFNNQFTNRWQKCIQRRHHCWYYTFSICERQCSVNFKMRWARYHSYYSGTVRTDKTDAACLLALTLDPFTTMTSGESTRTPRKSNACNEESIYFLSLSTCLRQTEYNSLIHMHNHMSRSTHDQNTHMSQ